MRDFKFTFEPEIVKAKSAEGESYSVWAYASTWDVDSDDCQITKEALEGAKDDLLQYNTVLFNHNYDKPIGKVVETKIDNRGLLVKIVISATENDLIAKVKDGTLSKLSISGRAMDWQMTTPDAEGRSILQITKIKLFEVSIVSVPANKEAKTISSSISKSLFLEKMQEEDTQKSLLADLQLLAGRMSGDDKAVLDKVLEFFKTTDKGTMKKDIKQYTFTDTSDARPVFQLNLPSESAVELGEGNTFRKQILKKGKWYHWSADNGQLEITEEKIDEIIKNFKAGVLDSVPVPLTHTNDPSKNTGIVKDLIKTEDGLDAIIEIKEESIVEKIKKGLITAISASFDPNYLVKKTKEFIGPVLLHAALVAEPYIKGMGEFVALSDEFDGREVVQLEETEFDVKESLKQVFKILSKVQTHIEKTETVEKVKKSVDEETDEKKEDAVEEETEETVDDVEAAKKKEGGKCKMPDGTMGTYDSDGKCVPKKEKKSIEEEHSSEAGSEETEAKADETKETKSDEAKSAEDVDLTDSVKLYEEYLKQGKIVPAQKDAFVALCDSLKTVQLADSSVDVKSMIERFMASQPKLVNFSEDGTVEDPTKDKPEEAAKAEELPEDVKDFYINKMHLSEDKAKEAWKFAKENNSTADTQKSAIFS